MPLTSTEDDIAAAQRIVGIQDGPMLLVGHSYGGIVISEVGMDPDVRGLVYIAAFQPDVGESGGALLASIPTDFTSDRPPKRWNSRYSPRGPGRPVRDLQHGWRSLHRDRSGGVTNCPAKVSGAHAHVFEEHPGKDLVRRVSDFEGNLRNRKVRLLEEFTGFLKSHSCQVHPWRHA